MSMSSDLIFPSGLLQVRKTRMLHPSRHKYFRRMVYCMKYFRNQIFDKGCENNGIYIDKDERYYYHTCKQAI